MPIVSGGSQPAFALHPRPGGIRSPTCISSRAHPGARRGPGETLRPTPCTPSSQQMTPTAQISAWLLQGAATLPDTIVTKQVVVSGWFGKVASVASGLVSIVLLVLLVVLVLVALKLQSKVGQLMDCLAADITPIARHTSSIADNVDYITTSIRTDVQHVSQTIQI